MTINLEKIDNFINFCQQHITGKERKEAQIFLDRFFQAFGYDGALEAGAKYEEAIKKGSQKGKTGFADLVWKPKLLIEMKKRGEDLNKHYPQAFEYWTRLVPDRPRYVLLCNFDEFWIFDFNIQLDEPVDIVTVTELKNRLGAFAFMELGNRTPVFKNNQAEVTEKAGKRMGELYQMLVKRLSLSKKDNDPPLPPLKRGEDSVEKALVSIDNDPTLPPLEKGENLNQKAPLFKGGWGDQTLIAQRFILQCVLAMFAEDRGLLPRDLFVSCVQECLNGSSSYDIIGGLFREMNMLGKTPAGKYEGVDYFNGGLFSEIHPIELNKKELEILDVASRQDWSKVRPAIFGNIFEGSSNTDERHAYGMHYTSEADIMKIVRPTISRFWEDKINQANTLKELEQLKLELANYKVLDPACGSGNFLYVAYQELKRIEQLLFNKIKEKSKGESQQLSMAIVTPAQFYGMDINPFAVELAKVTLMIARKVAIDKLNLTENPLPLDSLDHNIICQDALFSDWIEADAIIGNPPFLGGARIRQELGDNYAEKLFKKFADVKDKVDFCSYWFRLAHDNIKENGRAGLVGTNTISQGLTRKASLDYITNNNGYIHEAVSSQIWSGEAAVYVSIVNWCYEEAKELYLDDQIVNQINSSLTTSVDISQAKMIKANANYCFKGVQPTGKGFIITEAQAQEWLEKDTKNNEILKVFSDAKDLARNPHGKPTRWIIDFNDLSLEDASDYQLLFEYIKENVKPERDKNKDKKTREYWWLFPRTRPAMREKIKKLSYYFAIPRVSKWFIFLPIEIKYLPSDSTVVVASEDYYILGILTSKIHRLWIEAQCSTLGETTRYTHNTCFETFPFPQFNPPLPPLERGENSNQKTPLSNKKSQQKAPLSNKNAQEKAPLTKGGWGDKNPSEIIKKIRQTMIKLHQYRSEQMEKKQWGITQLYNKFFEEKSSQLYKLHQELDQLVMEAYGFKEDDDLLAKLLELNLELAQKEAKGEKIIGCWDPLIN